MTRGTAGQGCLGHQGVGSGSRQWTAIPLTLHRSLACGGLAVPHFLIQCGPPYPHFPDLSMGLPLSFNLSSGTSRPHGSLPNTPIPALPQREDHAHYILSAVRPPSTFSLSQQPGPLRTTLPQQGQRVILLNTSWLTSRPVATPRTFLCGAHVTHCPDCLPRKDSGPIACRRHLQLSEAPGVAPGLMSQPLWSPELYALGLPSVWAARVLLLWQGLLRWAHW